MKIVVINGKPRAGKDTFVELVATVGAPNYALVDNISTVDEVKDIARRLGWDGEKDLATRQFLSGLKDLMTQWRDLPFKYALEEVEKHRAFEKRWFNGRGGIVFIHSREPEEIQRFKDELGAITLLIKRDEVENQETLNHADANVFNYNYDYVIENNGTLKELENKAKLFYNNIITKEN